MIFIKGKQNTKMIKRMRYKDILEAMASSVLIKNKHEQYSNNELVDALIIFNHAMVCRMWDLQEEEGMGIEVREDMAKKYSKDLIELIRVYTGIDMNNIDDEFL